MCNAHLTRGMIRGKSERECRFDSSFPWKAVFCSKLKLSRVIGGNNVMTSESKLGLFVGLVAVILMAVVYHDKSESTETAPLQSVGAQPVVPPATVGLPGHSVSSAAASL
jgi:hypothetical protein